MYSRKHIGWGAIVVVTIVSSFFIGFEYGKKFPQNLVIRGVSDLETPNAVSADFSTFWQAWQVVSDKYLTDAEIAPEDKVHGAIRGVVASLKDPNSVFFNPEDSKKFEQDVRGSFSGIGAELGIRNDRLVIIAPLKSTPASQSGLEPGDFIATINGSSTEGISIDKAVSIIRGPEGTQVTLGIVRKGWDKARDFKITRAPIIAPTLDYELREGDIGYIHIHSFNANLNSLFYRAAMDLLDRRVRGIVLDLRNDPGGYLDVSVDMAGWFLKRDTLVVKEIGRDGMSQDFKAFGNELLAKMPVVVLVNQGSASASEILAGTLRDNRGIRIIGEQSFGKGTVQELQTLKDGSTMKITIAKWVLPSGQVLEGAGLKPDIEIKRTEDDVTNKKDPQLDKALETLREEIRKSREL